MSEKTLIRNPRTSQRYARVWLAPCNAVPTSTQCSGPRLAQYLRGLADQVDLGLRVYVRSIQETYHTREDQDAEVVLKIVR